MADTPNAADVLTVTGYTTDDAGVLWYFGTDYRTKAEFYVIANQMTAVDEETARALMAQIDAGNGGCPYESPSNKGLQCDGLCLEDGTEVNLTLAQANYLNGIGVDTALNFMSGWVAWGNYTACYPSNTDVKDYFIPVSRMFGWVGNSLVKTFWSKLDKPMTRRLIDTVLDSANIWLNGLVGMGYLLGARVEMLENENPLTNLMAGIIKLHVYMTPPSPAQEIDFVLEYDASYVTSALQG